MKQTPICLLLFASLIVPLIAIGETHTAVIEILYNDSAEPDPAQSSPHHNPSAVRKLLSVALKKQRETQGKWLLGGDRHRLARFELRFLTKVLESEGFYSSEIGYELQSKSILYSVDPGPIFRVASVRMELPHGKQAPERLLELKQGDFLRAQAVLSTRRNIEKYISEHFCLYKVDVDYDVTVAQQSQTASVVFTVAESPEVSFGSLRLTGLESIDSDYVRARISIQEGACFNARAIDEARIELLETNLFASVLATIGKPDGGSVAIEFALQERAHRTISTGIGFNTDEGFGISGSWEHRNVLGEAEQLAVELELFERAQRIQASITLPHYIFNEQFVSLYLDQENRQTEAFESSTGKAGIRVTRTFARRFGTAIGTELSFSRVEDTETTENFSLLSVPVLAYYDRRNDLLNPTSGWYVSGQFRPYWETENINETFTKTTLEGRIYASLPNFPLSPTFAVRGTTGSIMGANRESVPADIRFYTGGGGTIRGYPFQTVGPLNEEGLPTGGLASQTMSFESRIRFGKGWGMVAFIDGGNTYRETEPQLDERLLWGAGLGARYYSSFAPLRLDIAFPLNARDEIDDSFQIYASIGQSF